MCIEKLWINQIYQRIITNDAFDHDPLLKTITIGQYNNVQDKCMMYIGYKCMMYIGYKCMMYIGYKCRMYIGYKCRMYIGYKCMMYIG